MGPPSPRRYWHCELLFSGNRRSGPEGFRNWVEEEVNLEGVVANCQARPTLHTEEVTHTAAQGKDAEDLERIFKSPEKDYITPRKTGVKYT